MMSLCAQSRQTGRTAGLPVMASLESQGAKHPGHRQGTSEPETLAFCLLGQESFLGMSEELRLSQDGALGHRQSLADGILEHRFQSLF